MNGIFQDFPISESEYQELDEQFGKLGMYQSWQLIKKNSRNNHINSQEDFAQDLRISLLTAGSYYKRQVYIESCLLLCKKYASDRFLKYLVEGLWDLWKNKTRHGANKQKFGPYQERLLARLVRVLIPASKRPPKRAPLKIDTKFKTYAKAITWNGVKAIGKKITRSKSITTGQVSLSEYDYLGATY